MLHKKKEIDEEAEGRAVRSGGFHWKRALTARPARRRRRRISRY